MSVMLSAAGSLRWFRDALAPGVEFADLVAAAADVPAGSDGLLFLPYLSGERSPHPDPLARGAFVGLTLGHDRRHLTRAVLEGVAFGLRDGLDLMIAAGMPPPDQIRASGGGTASPLWRQILADVLGAEIATVDDDRGRGLRRRAAGGGRRRLVPDGRRRRRRPSVRATPVAAPGPDAARLAERARGLSRALSGAGADVPRLLDEPTLPQRRRGRRLSRASSICASSFSLTSPGRLPRMIMPSTSSGVTVGLVDRVRRSGRGT